MEPREFLRELMRRSGDNPNSLAAKLNKKTAQPQIYKFLEGIAKEPRRTTLKPVADFYKVAVEAFYSSAMADQEIKRLNDFEVITKDGSKTILEVKPPSQINERRAVYRVVSIESAVEGIANHLNALNGYNVSTVISLLSTLAHEPDQHPVVAAGLRGLKPLARAGPEKQISPAQKAH